MRILLNCFLFVVLVFSIFIAKEVSSFESSEIYHSYMVTVTAYSPSSNETDNTPNKTALLQKPVPGWTCAVSRDLMDYLGKRVYIDGLGVRKINDLMNKRYEKRIDLCMGKKEAIEFGVEKDIKIIFF